MNSEKFDKIYKVVMLVALTALITFIITSIAINNSLGNSEIKYVKTSDENNELVNKLEYYKSFIDKNYIYDYDEEEMIDSALKGYFKGLGDEYSEYISKKEMDDYLANATGKYVGIGVYIANDTKENKILVLAPMKGSPAEEAGIKPGDYIVKIDGKDYTGEELTEATNVLKAGEGTSVNVQILRDDKPIDLEITRKEIKIAHIESKVFDNNIGYIKISSFDDGCYKEFLEHYNSLKEKNITKLIIDLRDNGGGIVTEAKDIADLFVDKDSTLLITKSKNKEEELSKAKKDKEIDLPVVFLANEDTASASEILICAVKENTENTKIVGTKTYGKGVIQSIFTLKNGEGIKLTTEEYFSPKHNKINKEGITPDVEVELEIPEDKTKYEIEEKDDNQLKKALEIMK